MPRWRVIQEIPSDAMTDWFAYVQLDGYREAWGKQPETLSSSNVHKLFHGLDIVDGNSIG